MENRLLMQIADKTRQLRKTQKSFSRFSQPSLSKNINEIDEKFKKELSLQENELDELLAMVFKVRNSFSNTRIELDSDLLRYAAYAMLKCFGQKMYSEADLILTGQIPINNNECFLFFDEDHGYWDLTNGPFGELITLNDLFQIFKGK